MSKELVEFIKESGSGRNTKNFGLFHGSVIFVVSIKFGRVNVTWCPYMTTWLYSHRVFDGFQRYYLGAKTPIAYHKCIGSMPG